MKIVFVSDLHLSKSVYEIQSKEIPSLPFRTVDFMKSFEWIIDKCTNDIKPDLVIIGGDIYDYHNNMSNSIRGFFSRQMSKLVADNIPCILLIGNHDVCKKNHALQDIKELNLKTIKVIESPLITEFRDHRLLLFPYSLDIEQKKITIKEAFKKFIGDIKSKPSEKTSIFVGHFGVKNAILNQYSDIMDDDTDTDNDNETTNTTTTLMDNSVGRKNYYSRREDDVDVEWLDEIGAQYVILGDFHRHQILKTKCYGMYTGSIEKTDINEVDQKKGFVVYDSECEEIKEYGKCRFIEYPNCRPMIEIKGNMNELKRKFRALDHSKYQEAIVKLRFIGSEEELMDFSSAYDGFKKEIDEKLNPIHIFSVNKIKNSKLEKEATQLEKEIMEKGHITDEDILNIVEEMILEKVSSKKEQEKTKDLATEIYKEAMDK